MSIKSKICKNICGLAILFLLITPILAMPTLNYVYAADNGWWDFSEESGVDNGWWGVVKEGGVDKIGKTAFDENGKPDHIIDIVAMIIKVFLGFLGIIFVVLLVLAGFKWMTASGEEEKVREARDQILTSIIGILIVLASYAIAHFVLNKIIYATTGSEPVW